MIDLFFSGQQIASDNQEQLLLIHFSVCRLHNDSLEKSFLSLEERTKNCLINENHIKSTQVHIEIDVSHVMHS